MKKILNTWQTQHLLMCGIIAGPLFIIALTLEGATRSDYNPIRHPGSSLSLGDLGWMQVVNFIITGLLVICFAVGLRRLLRKRQQSARGTALLVLAGVGLLGAGIFLSDPVNGYPAGTPDILAHPTFVGQMHDLFSIGVFVGLPLACFVFAKLFFTLKEQAWALYSLVSGIVIVVTFVLTNLAFAQSPGLVDFGGALQRIMLFTGLIWMTLLAFYFKKSTDQPS